MMRILVLQIKGYTEKDICTCLFIYFGGQQGGLTALLSETNTDQLIDLNHDPLSQSILENQNFDINPPNTGTATNMFF
jgi:hypothetical protein